MGVSMKVLNINKYFFSKGGAETYYFELSKILTEHGQQVMHFSMQDSRNLDSPYASYFVKNIDYDKQVHIYQKIRNALKIIYSFEAKRKLKQLIKKERPDIAHLQNFHHQLSPSIVITLHKAKIPIVYTAHDLKLICPNYKMLRSEGVCEECLDGHYNHCLKHCCSKGSRAGSMVSVIEMNLAKWFKINQKIDFIITPSQFYKNKMIEWGIPSAKMLYLPNFIDVTRLEPSYESDDYFVYFGRLSEEKGILTLLKAMEQVPEGTLKIIGNGPMEGTIHKVIQDNEKIKNKIEMVGFKTGEKLQEILRKARFNILPSEWYENGPYSVLEMMGVGKPTIAAEIGGLPDMIQHEETGLLFTSGDVNDLSNQINKLYQDKELRLRLGKNCRRVVEQKHSQEIYYQQLYSIYEQLTSI
jgi:glycosyltransferase involved in cell wall biosynthesis